jgi:tRNA dimethylallyltransferase
MTPSKKQTHPPLIVLLGPTGVGKTALSLTLAERFNGEIVGADSRQIYRHMDIGTAKPTPAQRARVPHHLIDLCEPDEALSLADYQRLAYAAIDDIHRRGKVPFLVGGSALYLTAVVKGMRIPNVPPNPALRAELESFAQDKGHEALYRRLQDLDPATAEQIDARNVRRVVRALEIIITTGRPKSELEGFDPPPYRILQIGLDMPREQLYARIDARVHAMIAEGLVEETQDLLARDYPENLPALTSLGYREIVAYLRGTCTLEQAIEQIKIETHRFVRHQYTWFRRMKGVHWFDITQDVLPSIEEMIAHFLA